MIRIKRGKDEVESDSFMDAIRAWHALGYHIGVEQMERYKSEEKSGDRKVAELLEQILEGLTKIKFATCE
jgi:hypothetical protein